MSQDKFRNAEDEYFKLRGQFDTGRLTQEQFDEKLRELMQQDAQGRYWMLGADSAKWYYYDGTRWVQSDPYAGATPPLAVPAAPPVATTSAPPSPVYSPPPRAASAPVSPAYEDARGRGFPIIPLLLALLLLILGAAAFLVYQNRDRIFVAQAPNQITPILPPTITRAPSPTALSALATVQPTTGSPTLIPATLAPLPTAVPTSGLPISNPTSSVPTVAPTDTLPPITVIIVTAEPTATAVLPTLLPPATVPPTNVPTRIPTATRVSPTATTAPPTNTPAPNYPPGVYVTKIEYSSPARRNQNVTFTATFLNTTGGTSYYNWLVLLYDPEKAGANKGFGESPSIGISIPPGENKFSVTYSPVNGPGGCKNLYMRAGFKVSQFDKSIFPNTTGDPVTVYFDVCP